MNQTDLFFRFGVAIAISFLIGLQREYAKGGKKRSLAAGERTFTLFGLVGGLAAMAAEELQSPLAFVVVLFLAGLYLSI